MNLRVEVSDSRDSNKERKSLKGVEKNQPDVDFINVKTCKSGARSISSEQP